MATIAETLGANIRRIREEKGVSRKQLAEAVGVTEVSIGGYENGHKLPPLDKIFSLANALETSVISLTGDTSYSPDFPKAADIDRKIFEYRFQRAKKLLTYLDDLAELKGYKALHINEQGNISIFSPEKITYKDGMVTTYGKGQSITFKNAEIFVDVMEQAEHRALRRQIPFNQALNEIVTGLNADVAK